VALLPIQWLHNILTPDRSTFCDNRTTGHFSETQSLSNQDCVLENLYRQNDLKQNDSLPHRGGVWGSNSTTANATASTIDRQAFSDARWGDCQIKHVRKSHPIFLITNDENSPHGAILASATLIDIV
jgi:hypothetical protein